MFYNRRCIVMMLLRKFQELFEEIPGILCTGRKRVLHYLSEKAPGYILRGIRDFHATRWIYLLLLTK
jgi:DNA-binding MarR family transcriptional regulator